MATAALTKFHDFVERLAQGKHQLHAAGHQFKFYLSNAAPDASADLEKADLAEISTGNGYSGPVDIQNDMTEAGGTAVMTAVDATITAASAIGPFRYVAIYNEDEASDGLLGVYDYGTSVTLSAGESFIVDFGTALISIT
jgi:hypothetical protein